MHGTGLAFKDSVGLGRAVYRAVFSIKGEDAVA